MHPGHAPPCAPNAARKGRPSCPAGRRGTPTKPCFTRAALLDFDIQWLWPAPDAAGALCTCPVEPEALSSALDELAAEGRTPFGVYLTSPDYLGFVQDIAGLSGRSATPTACPFWWTTLTAPISTF